jgi:hypothetical protein
VELKKRKKKRKKEHQLMFDMVLVTFKRQTKSGLSRV